MVMRFPMAAAIAMQILMAAGIGGKWKFAMETDGGPRETIASFEISGKEVTGKWMEADVKGTFGEDKLELAFPFTSREGGLMGTLKITGKLEGETLAGKWEFAGYGGTFKASRIN
jgi:hypothetical protein